MIKVIIIYCFIYFFKQLYIKRYMMENIPINIKKIKNKFSETFSKCAKFFFFFIYINTQCVYKYKFFYIFIFIAD